MKRGYYVTAIRGTRVAYLSGPYRTHRAALGAVDTVRDAAFLIDPRTWFDLVGTASVTGPVLPVGKIPMVSNRALFSA